jgi:thioredoxin 1
MNTSYAQTEPSRAEVDAMAGAVVLEFGTPWCGYCRSIQPMLEKMFGSHPDVRHLKIEDGSGFPLGRSFGIKLWPTLVFLRDGREVARLVRPSGATQVREALDRIDPAAVSR